MANIGRIFSLPADMWNFTCETEKDKMHLSDEQRQGRLKMKATV